MTDRKRETPELSEGSLALEAGWNSGSVAGAVEKQKLNRRWTQIDTDIRDFGELDWKIRQQTEGWESQRRQDALPTTETDRYTAAAR